jgi:pyruvate dehydrogenase E2 component (dihydrolipoamide acetyltransferase)
MTLVALEIPKVGLVMENARLVRWLKNVGDVVQEGEPLLELETEKSVVEIESTHSGRLVEILLHADQEARVGDRIAWLDNDTQGAAAVPSAQVPKSASTAASESTPATPGAAAPASARATGAATALASTPAPAPASARTLGAAAPAAAGAPARAAEPASASARALGAAAAPTPVGRIKSSPVARRVAAEHTLDLRQVTGTGPRGRVQLIDVRRAIEAQSVRAADNSSLQGPQPLSNMRRALARSMTFSNATIPQFTVERAVDWTALHAQRAAVFAGLPPGAPKPSLNDFLLQAMAQTLLDCPALNATFAGDPNSPDACIVPENGAHIALVVAVENGLIVPVLHGVERFGLVELARLRSATVERALKGKLKREELEGATCSLSNLGAHGPDRFNAIVNPPESAILAVGRQRDCVVAINGEVHVRPMSQLTLTVDHRVADGRLASDFLARLVEILEGDAWRVK